MMRLEGLTSEEERENTEQWVDEDCGHCECPVRWNVLVVGGGQVHLDVSALDAFLHVCVGFLLAVDWFKWFGFCRLQRRFDRCVWLLVSEDDVTIFARS